MLTFDEFLSISPCTTGKHSIIDDTPDPDPLPLSSEPSQATPLPSKPIAPNDAVQNSPVPRAPQAPVPAVSGSISVESDSDDPASPIPANVTCRRRGCNAVSPAASMVLREGEKCVFHPGQALFHEGSKGWTCCKRRVLEFDEFMKIEGCNIKTKHLFVGSTKTHGKEENLSEVR